MNVNPVELLPLEQLCANPANPKKPLGLKYKRGLRASLDRFGFAGIFVVAANEDGTFEVLDGNTRLDELDRAGVEAVPCVVYRGLSAEDRKAFVLAHDRNRKVFDEAAVLSQLEELARNGANLKDLATLSAKDNLERLLAESSQGGSAKGNATTLSQATMGTLVLYGPAVALDEIRSLLKQVKGRISTAEKTRNAMAQAAQFLDWADEKVLAIILATVAQFGKGE